MKTESIRVAIDGGPLEQIEATVLGSFGVHPCFDPSKGRFTITHVPSGLAFAHAKIREKALDALTSLVEPWVEEAIRDKIEGIDFKSEPVESQVSGQRWIWVMGKPVEVDAGDEPVDPKWRERFARSKRLDDLRRSIFA